MLTLMEAVKGSCGHRLTDKPNHPVMYSTVCFIRMSDRKNKIGSSDVRDSLAECMSKSSSVIQFCVKPLRSVSPPMSRMHHWYMKPSTGTNKKAHYFRKGDRKPQISQFLSTLFHSFQLNNTKNLTSDFRIPSKYSSGFAQTCKKRNV